MARNLFARQRFRARWNSGEQCEGTYGACRGDTGVTGGVSGALPYPISFVGPILFFVMCDSRQIGS